MHPQVCIDETSKQLLEHTRTPISASPGTPARVDDEYKRCGTANMIELSVLARQCLHQRISSMFELQEILQSWEEQRNSEGNAVSWRFTTEDARIKLRRLYPTLECEK
jgi:hypothetical protein